VNASDERIAAILTDESMLRTRIRKLWTEAVNAGDSAMVETCRRALFDDESAKEECARVLAENEVTP
jgi:hypothetical protein